jgi:hypothetical protein
MGGIMSIVDIAGGALLLALGRKIFWLFIALIGFFAGFDIATHYLNIKPAWVALVIALGVGLLGALLAYFFEKLAIASAGFLVGAFIASRLATILGIQVKGWEWLVILAGGIIGLILMLAIFDWALILLSSITGALLVVQGLNLAGTVALITGVLLFIVGVIFQAGFNRSSRSRRRTANG